MALNEGDKAIVRDIAFAVGDVLMKRFDERIANHGFTCPAAQAVSKWRGQLKALVIGIAIGAAIIGSGGTIGLLKVFDKF